MKGTLFSADFVKDKNGDLRLIELNTDTGIVEDKIADINLAEFISILQTNSITSVHLIYKPFIHLSLVNHIKSVLESDASFITSITLHDEDMNSIYPTSIPDADDTFILRLAYDEAALFDSMYAKNRLNVFSLFYENLVDDKIVAFYHSSSNGIMNSLEHSLNDANLPDATIKDVDERFNPIDFYKLGSEVEGETNEDRWNSFVELHKAEDKLIEQYHVHPSSILEDNRITSTRQFSVVYGTELNIFNLISYKAPATFTLPESISSEVNSNVYSNKLADHHYFEYTTTYPSKGSSGVLSTHKVLMHPEGAKELGDMVIGDTVKSYIISGSPSVETNLDVATWSFEGNTLPSGSVLTIADVVYIEKDDLKYGSLIELTVDNDSIFSGTTKQYLVYDSGSNKVSFKLAIEINPSTDYFFDYDGNLIDIDEANLYITSDSGSKFVELDVEDADTYLISGSTAFNSIVSHNAPCFVAGTSIKLNNGTSLPIEDIELGTEVLTYDFKTNSPRVNKVSAVGAKLVQEIVEYTFSDSSTLKATKDHPVYSSTKGWVSSDPEYTSEVYNLTTGLIEIGDKIVKADDKEVFVSSINFIKEPTKVYNLKTVDFDHNFYANDVLVHNRTCFIAGTKVTLADGTENVIENIQIGDKVLTFNLNTNQTEVGTVGDLLRGSTEFIYRITVDNSKVITTTPDHPFYTKERGWVRASNLEPLDTCLNQDGTEGIISTVEFLKESHKVFNLLNVNSNHNFFVEGILVHNKL